MKLLSENSFESAGNFIRSRARPLEKAIFENRFESADAELVIAELQRFQNDDGGFGHALEPDVRTPSSSALATGIGLAILREIHCPAEHIVVHNAIRYLLDTFDANKNVWRVIPEDANAYPHAPWWQDNQGSLAQTFDSYQIIPRAQILGLLWHYAATIDPDWLNELTDRTVSDIEQFSTLGTGGGDTLRYTISLAETSSLPEGYQNRLLTRLLEVVPEAVSRNPTDWSSYSIRPFKVVTSPKSAFTNLLRDAVQENLDYLVEEQHSDGYWEPVWNWGDFFPDIWPQSRSEWRGLLTLEALTILKEFRRIQGRQE